MPNKTVIIDYGMGNLRSVQKKFHRVGNAAQISSDIQDIETADRIVLPGVGHFANGIQKLKEYQIWDTLNRKVLEDKVPILGICLGLQLFTAKSEEGNVSGLHWANADCVRFKVQDKLRYKVPHMGWNNIRKCKESKLLQGIPDEAQFYFVHTFHVRSQDMENVLCTTTYEYEFVSAIEKDNIYGVQFHPEKSHEWGEMIFKNFLNI